MIRLCVIGNPIFHSKSPEIHGELLRKAGIEGSYTAVRVLPEELPEFVNSAKAGAWDGFNVTMPHKETILPLLDELSPTANIDKTSLSSLFGFVNSPPILNLNFEI